MNATTANGQSYVVFPLGDRRFALPTADIVELSRYGQVQKFPHTSPELEGVLVRRGRILPVWNLASSLDDCMEVTTKIWLITKCNFTGDELTAIPVSGECQMFQAQSLLKSSETPGRALGILMIDDQPIEVLDLRRLRAENDLQDSDKAQTEEAGKKS